MADTRSGEGTIRKVWPTEHEAFRAHLLRLDAFSRHMRFGAAVSDAFIESYCDTAHRLNTVIYGYFIDGTLRAAAELRPLFEQWPLEAEAAFSVETPYQDQGLGTDLMERLLLAAQNRGIRTLYMVCLADNRRMQRIARKYEAQLHFDRGEVSADIDPAWPTYFSLLRETLDDSTGFVTAVLKRSA